MLGDVFVGEALGALLRYHDDLTSQHSQVVLPSPLSGGWVLSLVGQVWRHTLSGYLDVKQIEYFRRSMPGSGPAELGWMGAGG